MTDCKHLHIEVRWEGSPLAMNPSNGALVYRCIDCGEPWAGGTYTVPAAPNQELDRVFVLERGGVRGLAEWLHRALGKALAVDANPASGHAEAWELGYARGYDDREKMDHDRVDVIKAENPFLASGEPLRPSDEELESRLRRAINAAVFGIPAKAIAGVQDDLTELTRRLKERT